MLIPGQTPGIKEPLVDLYGKPELLFFGPDGTHLLFVSFTTFNIINRGHCRYDGLGS